MFYQRDDLGYKEAAEGVRLKTLVHGARTLLSEFRLEAGRTLPSHSHPHEQTGYLVSGHLKLIIEGREYDAKPGDSWCIQGDIVHSAEILEDSVVVEVFSPVREEYLP